MTKAELSLIVSKKTGFSKDEVESIISATNETIMDTVGSGEGVYMRGFGTFIAKVRKEKVARDIKKNVEVTVPEHSIPTFKPAPTFRAKMKE